MSYWEFSVLQGYSVLQGQDLFGNRECEGLKRCSFRTLVESLLRPSRRQPYRTICCWNQWLTRSLKWSCWTLEIAIDGHVGPVVVRDHPDQLIIDKRPFGLVSSDYWMLSFLDGNFVQCILKIIWGSKRSCQISSNIRIFCSWPLEFENVDSAILTPAASCESVTFSLRDGRERPYWRIEFIQDTNTPEFNTEVDSRFLDQET